MEKYHVEHIVMAVDKVFKGVVCEIKDHPVTGRDLLEFTWGIHHVEVDERFLNDDRVSDIDIAKFVCMEFVQLVVTI